MRRVLSVAAPAALLLALPGCAPDEREPAAAAPANDTAPRYEAPWADMGAPMETATCGNGVLELGEVCDDGNLDDNDACTATCMSPRCGDGVVQHGVEECDDGNSVNGDRCNRACRPSGAIADFVVIRPADDPNGSFVGRKLAVDSEGRIFVAGWSHEAAPSSAEPKLEVVMLGNGHGESARATVDLSTNAAPHVEAFAATHGGGALIAVADETGGKSKLSRIGAHGGVDWSFEELDGLPIQRVAALEASAASGDVRFVAYLVDPSSSPDPEAHSVYLSAEGELLSSRRLDAPVNGIWDHITYDNAGQVVFFGMLPGQGVFTITTAPTGELTALRHITPSSPWEQIIPKGITASPRGGYVLVGETKRPSASSERSCQVVAYDAIGAKQWSVDADANPGDGEHAAHCPYGTVAATPDGGVFFGGMRYPGGSFVPTLGAWMLTRDGEPSWDGSDPIEAGPQEGSTWPSAVDVAAAPGERIVVLGHAASSTGPGAIAQVIQYHR